MTAHQILEALAPCGLNCAKCFAHVDGDIRRYSLKLKEKLGNFEIYARRFERLLGNSIFEKYPDFKEMLDYLASESCRGCRNEQCKLFRSCGVRACHQEKNIDFCHQCDEFPCGNTGFDEHLHARWVKLNERIRAVGVEQYFRETRELPRYV